MKEAACKRLVLPIFEYGGSVSHILVHGLDMAAATLNCLLPNDLAMVRRICNVKARDKVSPDSLLLKRGIQNLDVVRHTIRLRWLGCIERSTG